MKTNLFWLQTKNVIKYFVIKTALTILIKLGIEQLLRVIEKPNFLVYMEVNDWRKYSSNSILVIVSPFFLYIMFFVAFFIKDNLVKFVFYKMSISFYFLFIIL